MKLAVSNIAWLPEEDEAAYELLGEREGRFLEAAPIRLCPQPLSATAEAVAEALARLRRHNLELVAFQALFFGIDGGRLFGSEAERTTMETCLQHLCGLAAATKARALVFGAPALRRIPEELSREEAAEIALPFFTRAAQVAAELGVCICLEPNPPAYGTNYLTDLASAADTVRAIDSVGCRLQLDAGALALNGEDPHRAIDDYLDLIGHIHISQPMLADFSAPSPVHRPLARALQRAGYTGPVSIEMKRASTGLTAVRDAIDFVRDEYGAR